MSSAVQLGTALPAEPQRGQGIVGTGGGFCSADENKGSILHDRASHVETSKSYFFSKTSPRPSQT